VVAPSDVPGADMGLSGGNPNDASYGNSEGGTSSSTPGLRIASVITDATI